MSKLEFVVHQDDVRRLSRRHAGGVRQRLEAIGDGRIGVHVSVRHQVGNGGHARARETRHVVVAQERFPRLLRGRQGRAHEGGGADGKSRRGGPQPDAKTVDPPDEHQRRERQREREQNLGIEVGPHRQQKPDRVAVDDHHVEEIRSHPDDVVLEPRQQDQDDDDQKRQRGRNGGTAQHGKPEEVEEAPGEAEEDLRPDRGFAPDHEAECGEMQRRDQRNLPRAAPNDRIRCGPAAQKCDGGRHGERPCPAMTTLTPGTRSIVIKLHYFCHFKVKHGETASRARIIIGASRRLMSIHRNAAVAV